MTHEEAEITENTKKDGNDQQKEEITDNTKSDDNGEKIILKSKIHIQKQL